MDNSTSRGLAGQVKWRGEEWRLDPAHTEPEDR